MRGEGTFPISLKVSVCANGETFAYDLMLENTRVATTFLTGPPSPERRVKALRSLLAQTKEQQTYI